MWGWRLVGCLQPTGQALLKCGWRSRLAVHLLGASATISAAGPRAACCLRVRHLGSFSSVSFILQTDVRTEEVATCEVCPNKGARRTPKLTKAERLGTHPPPVCECTRVVLGSKPGVP